MKNILHSSSTLWLAHRLTKHKHTVLVRTELFRPSYLSCIWCFSSLIGWLVDFDNAEVIDWLPDCPVDWFTGQLTGCMSGSLNGSQMFERFTTCVSEQLVNTLVLFCFKCFFLYWTQIQFKMVTHQILYLSKWALSLAVDTSVNFWVPQNKMKALICLRSELNWREKKQQMPPFPQYVTNEERHGMFQKLI